MSKEQAKGFFEAISKDKQLAEEVKEVVGGITSNEVKESELFDLARGHGFNFTKNEALSLTKDELKTSLKIESLSDVSGGAKGSIKPAIMAAFLLAGMGVSGAAISNMEASAAPPKVQAEQNVTSYDVHTAEDFVNFFTSDDYRWACGNGVTINLRSDISLTADQAQAVMKATHFRARFRGTLDGGGHSITLGFTEPADGEFDGLFNSVTGATFRNLRIQFDRLVGTVSGVFVRRASDSTFDNVVVAGNSIDTNLDAHSQDGMLSFGSISSRCYGTCKLDKCIAQVSHVNFTNRKNFGVDVSVGGCVGYCIDTNFSGCAFSGTVDVNYASPVANAGAIVGSFGSIFKAPVLDNCVVSNSQITASSSYGSSSVGALAGHCFGNSTVRNSAVLDCSVSSDGNYTGQLVGDITPDSRTAKEPKLYGCFYTNENGPAVGRERTPGPNATIQADQDTIRDALPDLVPVIERLKNQHDTNPADSGEVSDEIPDLGPVIEPQREQNPQPGVSGAAISNMEASAMTNPPAQEQQEGAGQAQAAQIYEVHNEEDFVKFFCGDEYQKTGGSGITIKLCENITLTGRGYWCLMEAFRGILEGDGHSITLDYTNIGGEHIHCGLFDKVEGATFRNVQIVAKTLTQNCAGVLTNVAVNSTFENVTVVAGVIKLALPAVPQKELHMGLLACDCQGDCRLTNCVGRVGAVTVRHADLDKVAAGKGFKGKLCFGGLVGRCTDQLHADSCAFSGDFLSVLDKSSEVVAGGIVGSIMAQKPSVIENCVVVDSRFADNFSHVHEHSLGTIAGECALNIIIRNSASLNNFISDGKSYSHCFLGSAVNVKVRRCVFTAHKMLGTSCLAAKGLINPDDVNKHLPGLSSVVRQVQTLEMPSSSQSRDSKDGLILGALKWVGSWFGLGEKK